MAKAGNKGNELDRLRYQLDQARRRIDELEAEKAVMGCGLPMRLPIAPLPADSRCFVFTRVDATLHGEIARKFTAIFRHLQNTHATVPAPAYAGGVVHVDRVSQCIQWVVNQIELTGAVEESDTEDEPATVAQ